MTRVPRGGPGMAMGVVAGRYGDLDEAPYMDLPRATITSVENGYVIEVTGVETKAVPLAQQRQMARMASQFGGEAEDIIGNGEFEATYSKTLVAQTWEEAVGLLAEHLQQKND